MAELPQQPLLVVGNEIFDAIPIRQIVKASGAWCERVVGVDEHCDLGFQTRPVQVSPDLLPPDAQHQPDGAIVELAPARSALMMAIAGHIRSRGGSGLFLDYGHLEHGFGDTLQALRRHGTEHCLRSPGEADLTSHVDFAELVEIARSQGLATATATQGHFLVALGLLERAGRLGATADEPGRTALRSAVERLAAPDQMGTLFKVFAIGPTGLTLPGFDTIRS